MPQKDHLQDRESAEEDDQEAKDRRRVGCVRLAPGPVRQLIATDALPFEAVVEAEVGHRDDDPGIESCHKEIESQLGSSVWM